MKLKVAVIGVGYWGPNFVRNFIRHPEIEMKSIADLSERALDQIKSFYPQISATQDYRQILNDSDINLVLISTPPETHFKIAKEALEKGKHIIVAKPLTLNFKQAQKLIELAKLKKLLIHGDLTYIYTDAVEFIKKFIEQGKMGQILYYDSTRANLGLIQKETSVIWDLVPHDLAILDYCFKLKPERVYATAAKYYGNSKNYEMAHITINYENNFTANINVSWLSPIKLRTLMLGGSKKMIFYNDVEPDEKIRIYDKGIDLVNSDITYMKPIYRNGDVLIPKLKNEEAIYSEINEIIEILSSKTISYENAEINLRIIKILEACDKSIKLGRSVKI